jgi:hypothetical protein
MNVPGTVEKPRGFDVDAYSRREQWSERARRTLDLDVF